MSVTVTRDNRKKVDDILNALIKEAIIVGVPEDSEKAERTDSELSNYDLGYMIEFGEPALNRPARAFLIPGTKAAIPGINTITKRRLEEILHFNSNIRVLQDEIGEYVVYEVQNVIDSKDIYDTGQLSASITYEIINKTELK